MALILGAYLEAVLVVWIMFESVCVGSYGSGTERSLVGVVIQDVCGPTEESRGVGVGNELSSWPS